jgi:hypothetical protein
MDIPEVRRRVRASIDQARRDLIARRERNDAATREFDVFLAERAVPAFNQVASALTAEGHRFKVFTPAGAVRLSSERSNADFIELTLETAEHRPVVLGRSSIGRGRGATTRERPVRPGASPSDLSEEDVIEFLLAEIAPFVER